MLVHGGLADGSGWEGVCLALRDEGCHVAAVFAADVPKDKARFMAASQVPWGVAALTCVVSAPAWRSKPSWYPVATEDKMIAPAMQRERSARAASKVVVAAAGHVNFASPCGGDADLQGRCQQCAGQPVGFREWRPATGRCIRTSGPHPMF